MDRQYYNYESLLRRTLPLKVMLFSKREAVVANPTKGFVFACGRGNPLHLRVLPVIAVRLYALLYTHLVPFTRNLLEKQKINHL